MTTPGTESPNSDSETRSGYVTLLGRPNAGKSTLLNTFLEERLSIVTPKAQTTWRRVTGIWTGVRAQIVFLDTPGLLEPRDLLQRSMLAAALQALSEADVLLLVLDATEKDGPGKTTEVIRSALSAGPPVPLLAAVNKADIAAPASVDSLMAWVSGDLNGEAHRVSALHGTGTEALRERLEELLPPGPFLYPPDEIARDPVRFFVAELVRETVFQSFHQEIPYSVACRIEEFREDQDPLYIQSHLFVERNSQKRILIGKGGSSIRKLGSDSRKKIEEFLQRAVYLDLWVKVLKDWRRKRGHLRTLGYSVPDEDQRGTFG
jgi:GTP-binding protein Era